MGAACPLPGPVASSLPRLSSFPPQDPGRRRPLARPGPRTFEPASGLRARRSREVPSPSARLAQFRRPLRSETTVPRAGGWRTSAGTRKPSQRGRGGSSSRRGYGEGLGAQERPGREGAPRRGRAEPGVRRPRAAQTARRWARSSGPRSPVGLGGRVPEARERGRGDTAAPAAAAAACPALGRGARGSGTCLRPCDPGAAPAAAPTGEAASSTQPGPGAAVWSAPRAGRVGVTLPRAR